MTGERRFARLRAAVPTGSTGLFALPDDGLCLNTFLIVHPRARAAEVLLGRPDPSGPWETIASMSPERLRTVGDRWILPASQLLFFEAPGDAAQRVAREQLGLTRLPVTGPDVFSEAYGRDVPVGRDPHWDIQFIYRGRWPGRGAPHHPAWKELRFVDPRTLRRNEFGRGHGDIVELAGFKPKD
jgi:hypothetical protein